MLERTRDATFPPKRGGKEHAGVATPRLGHRALRGRQSHAPSGVGLRGDMARPLGGRSRIAHRRRMGRLDVRCQPWLTGQR